MRGGYRLVGVGRGMRWRNRRMRGGRCWCWWFCGWLDYQEKKNFGAVGGSELELGGSDRLVRT